MSHRIFTYRASVCCLAVLAAAAVATSLVSAQDATTQPAASQPTGEIPVVQVDDKASIDANMGKDVTVDGVVDTAAWSPTGKVLRVEFKGNQQSKLQAVLFASHRKEFDDAYSGDIAKSLIGAHVRIRGKLETYQNRPEVRINRPVDLTILEPGPSTPSTTPSGG